MTDSANTEYVAGSCNIGPAEIHRRYQAAIVSGIAYLVLTVTLFLSDASTSTRLIAFLPAMGASVGFVQARRRFCLAYGFAGLFSFEKAGATSKVKDPAALKADRAYALRILITSFIPAMALTLLVVIL
jgi:hypothetical protein